MEKIKRFSSKKAYDVVFVDKNNICCGKAETVK